MAAAREWRLPGLAMLLLVAANVAGSDPALEIEVDVGAALYESFGAENVRARVFWVERRPRFELRADRLELPEPVGRVDDVILTCPRVDLTQRRLACEEARVSATGQTWGLHAAPLAFDWDRDRAEVRFGLQWPGLFQGRGRIDGLVAASGLRLEMDLTDIDLHALQSSGLLPFEIPVAFDGGTAGLSGHIDTRRRVSSVQMALSVDGWSFSDDLGLRAGEDVALDGAFVHGAGGWDVQFAFTEGAVFFEPWFLDFAEVGRVELSVSGLEMVEIPARDRLAWRASEAHVRLGDHTELRGRRLRHSGAELEQAEIVWQSDRLDSIGDWITEPLLTGTVLGRTRFEGSAQGAVTILEGRPNSLLVNLRDFGMRDGDGRFALDGLTGEMEWQDEGPGLESYVAVDAGAIFGLPVGPFEVRMLLEPRGVRLLEPVLIPILDGGPSVDVLRVSVGPEGPEVEFEGGIRALSLERLTEALGWPRFAGKLAGIIPRVSYDADGLRVDGRLLVQVFEGEAVLRDLRIRDLFGVAPVLEVSAEIRRLELELLTRAFDFGRIEGRLSGRLDDLVLVGWQPYQMRLTLGTPTEDPGRRRISQRAVENLAAIGGGIQGALSMVFLRFFEDFSYRQLGFSCELEGTVCKASGVADGPNDSFVLVQGGGLPRIDVIGHNRRVDWPELVRRLDAVREGPPPVVQ